MKNIKKIKIYFLFLSVIILFIDQLTKYIVEINYNEILNKDYIFFSVNYVKNYGAAFNLFSGSRIFLSIVSVVFTFLFFQLIIKDKIAHKYNIFTYSSVLGGCLGNGIDRVAKGYVVDFIDLNFINFPVFNIADTFISVGFFLILYRLVINKK